MRKDKSSLGYSQLSGLLLFLGLLGGGNILLYLGQEFGRGAEKKEF